MPSPLNPFPGPQPYRTEDRERFFGREETGLDLADAVLSHRVLTVFGPSGAGKSSLLQAAVVPDLQEDWDLRAATIDAWPPQEILAAGPAGRLVEAIVEQLGFAEQGGDLEKVLGLAFRRSDRALLIVLDQLEQLLVHHELEVLQEFVACLVRLEAMRGVALHVVLALREDYLGRWTDLLREHPQLLRHSFRLSRLSVAEITGAVLQAAATGEPAQRWHREALQPLIEEMAIPGQWISDATEVESAYVQIVCRALWEAGGPSLAQRASPDQILQGYLEDSLQQLGRLGGPARQLLETRFITRGGSRIPVTREAALEEVGDAADLDRILDTLERARILRAQQHHGDRFFELGHDWLARPIQESAERRRQQEAERRSRNRRLAFLGLLALALVLVGYFFYLYLEAERAREVAESALAEVELARQSEATARLEAEEQRGAADVQRLAAEQQRSVAEQQTALAEEKRGEAEAAREEAETERERTALALEEVETERQRAVHTAQLALDTARMQAVRELSSDPGRAAPFLRDVVYPRELPKPGTWIASAYEFLQRPPSLRSGRLLSGDERKSLEGIHFSPAGDALALALRDGRVRVRELGGAGNSLVLEGHTRAVSQAVFSEDGRWILTISGDRTARLWSRSSGNQLALLEGFSDGLQAAAFDRQGTQVAIAGQDGSLGLWSLDRDGSLERRLEAAHGATIWTLAFSSDGRRLLSASADGSASIWKLPQGRAVSFPPEGGTGPRTVLGASFDPRSARRVLIASSEDAWLWDIGKAVQRLEGHEGYVTQASFSPAGPRRALTLTRERVARIWDLEGALPSGRVLPGCEGGVDQVAFAHDGQAFATACSDGTVLHWRLAPDGRLLRARKLLGHTRSITALGFSVSSLLSVDDGASLRRWSASDSDLSLVLPGVDGRQVRALGFDGEGGVLVASLADGTRLAWTMDGGIDSVPAVAAGAMASQGSARLGAELEVMALEDGAIRVRRGDKGTTAAFDLAEHTGDVHVLQVSPDGRHLASAAADGALRLWTLFTLEELQQRLTLAFPHCVPVADRMRFLGENRERAQEAFEECGR